MTIQTNRNGAITTLEIEGRVDTMTSPQLQQAVLQAFQGAEKVVLDFAKVTYISSAGLRVLLIGQKTAQSKHMSMVLTNVGETVKNVLDMVGFSPVMNIEWGIGGRKEKFFRPFSICTVKGERCGWIIG